MHIKINIQMWKRKIRITCKIMDVQNFSNQHMESMLLNRKRLKSFEGSVLKVNAKQSCNNYHIRLRSSEQIQYKSHGKFETRTAKLRKFQMANYYWLSFSKQTLRHLFSYEMYHSVTLIHWNFVMANAL